MNRHATDFCLHLPLADMSLNYRSSQRVAYTLFSIFLGLTSRSQTKDSTRRYEIESVRQPKERIDMYENDPFDRVKKPEDEGAQMIGPYDLALVRLTTDVTFIPEKLVPVWQQ